MRKKPTKYLSKEDALKKLQRYCAYQERCHQEVRNKLLELRIYGDDLEEIIADLISDNYLNEERFAKIYAGGKFRIKKWGRVRILKELKLRKISAYSIKKAMAEIDEADYLKTLHEVFDKRYKNVIEPNEFKLKGNLAKYAMSRGFETNIIWRELKKWSPPLDG
ncbi:MAG: regulatory protein RecX [Bacteroidota bacterium]